MAASAMTHDWAKTLVFEFANWLHTRYAAKPGVLKLYRSHCGLFERLDAQFIERVDATAEAILEFIGTAGLRKHLLASKFVAERLGIEFTEKLKIDAAERDRIKDKLLQCHKQPWALIVDRYYQWLQELGLPVRTVRLYLSTAVTFCESVQMQNQVWNDFAIRDFLQRHPGLRNNLSKFVGHCQRSYGWSVKMPPRESQHRATDNPRKLVLELRKLTQQVGREGVDQVELKVLEKIIAKSLGFRIGDIAGATNAQFVGGDEQFYFLAGEEIVPIPSELARYFAEYARRRKQLA